MNKILYSSNIQTYETPHDLFEKLNNAFNFNIDVASTEETAKCLKFFTPKEDGLKQSWSGNCWCNPPYSKFQMDWVKKAVEERNKSNVSTMVLIPARVDTKLWQNIIFNEAFMICFINGRLKFHNCTWATPFPSALIWISNNINDKQIDCLESLGFCISTNFIPKNFATSSILQA